MTTPLIWITVLVSAFRLCSALHSYEYLATGANYITSSLRYYPGLLHHFFCRSATQTITVPAASILLTPFVYYSYLPCCLIYPIEPTVLPKLPTVGCLYLSFHVNQPLSSYNQLCLPPCVTETLSVPDQRTSTYQRLRLSKICSTHWSGKFQQ